MKTATRSMVDIRREGLTALRKALGPVDALRFIMECKLGKGDYTAERHVILGDPNLKEIVDSIRTRRVRKAVRKRKKE